VPARSWYPPLLIYTSGYVMADPLPKLIDSRFRVQGMVGKGAVGTVYKAVQEPLDRLVALKVLNPELADQPAARRRFFREARAAARLSHPNVVQIHDFGETEEGQLFLAMEWVPGGSMAQWKSQPPELAVVIGTFDQLLQGLAAAHAGGVLHRDLKPENLMLRGDTMRPDRLQITDFGLASVFDAQAGTSSGTETWGGTPKYMAPEQVRADRPPSPETDVYAVGILLYELFSGAAPFDGEWREVMRRQVSEEPPEMVARAGYTLRDELRQLVSRALRKEPERRYRSAAEMREALLAAMPGPGAVARVAAERVPAADNLFGRDAELREMRQVAVGAMRGRGTQVLLLTGAMGTGKSTLASVLGSDMIQRGLMSLVRTRCDAESLGSSGFAAVVEELLGIRGCGREEARRRIQLRPDAEALLGGVEREDLLDDLRPRIADSLLLDLDDPGGGRASRFARALRGAAGQRPLMILLDDLQRAQLDDLEVLQRLVALDVGDARALVVVGCLDDDAWGRDDARRQLLDQLVDAHAGVHAVAVAPLSPEACLAMLDRRLNAGPGLAQAVVDQVGTNPRIAMAVAELAVSSGHTQEVDGKLELLDAEALEGQVPDDVRSLIRARIENTVADLPDGQVALRGLVAAAVLGERFEPELAAELCVRAELADDLEQVRRSYEHLVDAGLLEDRGDGDDDRLSFATLLLRREVLNLLRATTRQRLHAEAATLLKAQGDRSRMHVVKAIAHHLFGAGEDAEGQVFLQRAAELAHASWMLDEAVSLFAELLDSLPEGESPEQAQVRLALGRIHVRKGNEEEARELLVALPEWAPGPVAAEAALKLVDLALNGGNTSEASAWLMLARERRPTEGPRAAWFEGELTLLQERLLRTRGDLTKRIEFLEAALERLPDDDPHRLRCEMNLAMAWSRGGRMDEGSWLLGEIEKTLPDDVPELLRVELVLDRAIIADIRGDTEEASRRYRQVLDSARRAGDPQHISQALVGLAEIARSVGQLDDAEQQYRDALEIQRRMGHQRFIAITLVNLCMVALARGELDEADRHLDAVLDLGADTAHPEVAVVYAFSRALVAGRRGDLDQARHELHRYQAVNARVGLHEPDIAEALEELGGLFLAGEDEEYGVELIEQAARQWEDLGLEDKAAAARIHIE